MKGLFKRVSRPRCPQLIRSRIIKLIAKNAETKGYRGKK